MISLIKPRRTTHVIYCYKVVSEIDNKYYPAIQNIGKPYKSGKSWAGCGSYYTIGNKFYFGKGWFFAFLRQKDAIEFANALWNGKYNNDLKIIKCIIPKRSKYTISSDRKEICSKYMIFFH